MNVRKITSSLGFIVALGVPLTTFADMTSAPIYDESGAHIVTPQFGAVPKTPPLAAFEPLRVGDISTDREYIYLGDELGWQIRQMQYRYENGRLVHIDDPVGHMARSADNRPLTKEERTARLNSGGN